MSDWRGRFEKLISRMEQMGQTAANKAHRGFVNLILLFIAYNTYVFISSYNSYWRLRRVSFFALLTLTFRTPPSPNSGWKKRRGRGKRIGRSKEIGLRESRGWSRRWREAKTFTVDKLT